MKYFQRPLEDLGEDLLSQTKGLKGRGMRNKKVGSGVLTITEVSFFLQISKKTILAYYAFAEDNLGNLKFDFPMLPCYYKGDLDNSYLFWKRTEIIQIKEFQNWVKTCRGRGISLNMMEYRRKL